MEVESTNTKKFAILGVISVLFVVSVYFYFFRTSAPKISLDQFGNRIQDQAVGQDFVSLLGELQSVTLDTSIFQSQAFQNLTGYTAALPSEPQGRADPFKPFSGAR